MGKIKALKGLGKAFLKSGKKKSDWKKVWQPVREVDKKTGKSTGPYLLMKVQTKKSWQDKRIQAMNRIIKKHPKIPGYTRSQTERFIDEYGKVSSSKAKTKKEYKGKK